MPSRNSDIAEDTASQRSGTSGTSGTTGAASETSSQRSDSKFLKRERAHAERDERDLLEQKRSIQDGVFSCMYTLVRQSALSSWKFAVLKIILEGLMGLIVVFNPSITSWKINTSNSVWQIVRWTVWRSPIARLYGYDFYIVVMYIMVAAVFIAVVGLVWLTLAMRRQEQSKWLRLASIILHIVYDVMFTMFYVSFFDYFVFTANCNFTSSVKDHVHFEGVMCLEMPHVLHMTVGLITAAIFFCVTALLVVASSDLNPVSQGYLASPAAIARLKILTAKAVYVVAANDFQSWPKLQATMVILSATLICWWNFRRLPFYRTPINIVWCSQWFGVLYVAGLLIYLAFCGNHSYDHQREFTIYVLYGIFPVIAGGIIVCTVHAWWAMRPVAKFKNLPLGVKIKKIHKFDGVDEVELLSRVMRKFGIDNTVEEEAAALGETIIKAGMQVFPNSPFLLILYANFQLEVRKDGPAARTQLQLASRHTPSLVERYQIFCTNEASKRLKDSQDGGMDLQAYIEFRRNFRAVLRVHKEVLLLQTDLWTLMLRSSLRVAEVDKALDALEMGTARAHQVYRRVLERYPTNGKLLRCYGKFLEDVKHDPVAASRAYGEANRNGGGDAIMSLDLSGVQGAQKPEFLTNMSMVDDAVFVINAEGQIMMVSQAVQTVFGYPKIELEGANVSLLMPQPFSQRHNGYLQRYANGGEPHILDTVREVVALHKERYVFPIALCVTKMSGTGADSIFLGVARPLPVNQLNMRAWLAPNGVFLCGDQQFASLCGVVESELIGRSLTTMVANDTAEVEQLLERCREAPPEVFDARTLRVSLLLKHRYLDPVPVNATVTLAGTDAQRIFVLNCSRVDGDEGNMIVVDSHMRLRFASCGMSTLLGFPVRKLSSMRLDQLLPPPYNTLHSKYLRDLPAAIPPTSCRAGRVVHLLNENGSPVPVRLKISTATAADTAMTLYVVQIEKKSAEEVMSDMCLVVTANFGGRVLSVSQPDSDILGFRSADMVGRSLCDTIDIFQEWRDRAGESQMQLLMLALLDKEHEMPGTSWRVRVRAPVKVHTLHSPGNPTAKPTTAAAKDTGAKSACLQVELQEDAEEREGNEAADDGGDGEAPKGSLGASSGALGTPIRVTLWRRDLLSGVVELDEELVIRRASPLTGLIVGMPSTAMLKKPIQRFLDIPLDTTWDKLTAAHTRHKQRGGLKAPSGRGTISPLMAFIGPHPDTGTMRIVVQGVQVLAPGGRSKVTITMHPDTTFAGAHADLMRVLHLDAGLRHHHSSASHAKHIDEGGDQQPLIPQSRRQGSRAHRQSSKAGAAGSLRQTDGKEDKHGGGGAGRGVDGGTGADDGSCGGQPAALLGATSKPLALPVIGEEGAEAGEERSSDEGDEGEESDQSGEESKDGSDRSKEESKDGSDGGRDSEAEEQARSLSRAASKSDFVAQWVRTLTKRASRTEEHHHGAAQQPQQQQHHAEQLPGAGTGTATGASPSTLAQVQSTTALSLGVRQSLGLHKQASTRQTIPEVPTGGAMPPGDLGDKWKTGQSLALGTSGTLGGRWNATGSRQTSRDIASPPTGAGAGGVKGDTVEPRSEVVAGGDGGGGGGGDKWEKGSEAGESSTDGSQAASGFTGTTDQQSMGELMIDSRRCRLLKNLLKQLLGPVLTDPMERLRIHSYILLAIMLATHVVAYIVVTRLIKEQHHDVNLVHRQALAMDRSQLIAVRVMMGAFCERANVTAKVSVCANSLEYTLGKLKENIGLMEQHHRFVYLGESQSDTVKLMPEIFAIWTNRDYEYHSYLDTATPEILHEYGGAWVIGNRFIAAAREALYWLPAIRDRYRLHRTYQFLVDNGLGPLFTCYAKSLDYLVNAAWKSVDELRTTLLVLLVVEPLFIQLSCLAYEAFLVQRLERSRLVGILAMVGLPGPVLRQLATKEAKVLDDSDSDDDDSDSDADDEPREGQQGQMGEKGDGEKDGGGPNAARGGGGGTGVVKGVRHADSGDGVAHGKAETEGATAAAAAAAAGVPVKSVKMRDGQGGGGVDPSGATAPFVNNRQQAAAGKEAQLKEPYLTADVDGGTEEGGGAGEAKGTSDVSKMRHSRDGGGGGPSSGGAGGAKDRKARVRGLHINGKELLPSYGNLAKFMVPFALWNIALIVMYVVSLMQLNSMQGPLASLNMASHIIYRYTRVRAVAFGYVSQDDSTSKSLWREMLARELRYFESEYNALMYGGVPMTQLDSVFQHAVPASTFASSSFATEFFRSKRCFRYVASECIRPGDPFFEVTRNGIDVMVRRMLSEMWLLSLDADEDASYNSSRYIYMYKVGGHDLYEGLQQAAQLFVDYSISRYDAVAQLHTILLVITIVLAILFVVFVLWPHLTRLKNDASRQSALLSHVPPEMDVRGHVRAVFRRAIGKKQAGGKAAASSS